MRAWPVIGLTFAAVLLTLAPSRLTFDTARNPFNITSNTSTRFDHIVVIVMENKATSSLIDNPYTPYISSLIRSSTLVTNYYAIAHPSLPNYLALLGGDNFGVESDCTDCFISAPNLVDLLESKGLSWKAYMESMPSPCFIGSTSLYAQKHNPFIYFDNTRANPSRCNMIVPLTQLPHDIATADAPNFIWITPNLCSDTHDCPLSEGDSFLSNQVTQLLSSAIFIKQNSLLLITWDEDDGSANNQVPLFVISPKHRVKMGSNRYDHYSLLKTIESSWGLPSLTKKDQQAIPLEFIPNS